VASLVDDAAAGDVEGAGRRWWYNDLAEAKAVFERRARLADSEVAVLENDASEAWWSPWSSSSSSRTMQIGTTEEAELVRDRGRSSLTGIGSRIEGSDAALTMVDDEDDDNDDAEDNEMSDGANADEDIEAIVGARRSGEDGACGPSVGARAAKILVGGKCLNVVPCVGCTGRDSSLCASDRELT